MLPLRSGFLPAVLTCVAVAGCGGGGDNGGSAGSGSSSSVADKSPKEIQAATAAALAKVRSYHVEGSEQDKDGTTQLSGDVTAAGDMSLRMQLKGRAVALILLGDKTYMKADKAFWRDQGGPSGEQVAELLGDRWVLAPEGVGADLTKLRRQLAPKGLARCAARPTGTLTKQGPRDLEGQQAVVIIDKGDKPGQSPGEVWVASTGRPLPLRVRQTGPRKPGGTLDPACDDKTSTTTSSDLRFTKFDEAVAVKAPAKPIDLQKALGGGSGGGSSATGTDAAKS